MPSIQRPYVVLAHLLSQFCYKYIALAGLSAPTAEHGSFFEPAFPPPYAEELDLGLAVEQWSLKQWKVFLQREEAYPSGLLPRLQELMRRHGLSTVFLAEQAYQQMQLCEERQAKYLLFGDELYPRLLTFMDDPPMGLTVLGDLELLNFPSVAVIGSRKSSSWTLAECMRLGRRLAELGIVSVSGGAYGCDIAVHQGVLSLCAEGGRALGVIVFAGGLDQLYPSGNIPYFQALLRAGGMFVSERLWKAPARPYDFPTRNRIISGLTWELVVMQAGEKSGAMITAQKALDQGREVLVLRHPSGDIRAIGSLRLILEGAYSFSDADDLLCNYRFAHERGGSPVQTKEGGNPWNLGLQI